MHRNSDGEGSRGPEPGGRLRLLAWDAPNMDMCLSEVLGTRPTSETRPNLEALRFWLESQCQEGENVEACIFANVAPGYEQMMAPWVVSLRHQGFAVFVRPKLSRNDDVDADILSHVQRRFEKGVLVSLTVGSHDAKAFREPLLGYAAAGVAVQVIGYREQDTYAATAEGIVFVDLETLPAVFARPLPRTNLFDLPPGGRWFDPFPAPGASGSRGDSPAQLPTAAPVAEPSPPTREEVLAVLASRVATALARQEGGIRIADAGELLRRRFAGFGLYELGFESVSDLVDTLCSDGLHVVVRTDAGHILTVREPSPLSVEAATTVAAPEPTALPAAIDLRAEEAASGSVNPIYRVFGGQATSANTNGG